MRRNVARNGNLSSDSTLISILELTQVVQDFEDGLQIELSLRLATLDSFVDMQAKAASQRLKALRREHSALASNLGFAAATIDVHHKLLMANDPPDTSTLIQCACTIKEYIDDVLARPPITLYQMAIVDWTNLLEILMLMAKVSKPLPSSVGWEAGALKLHATTRSHLRQNMRAYGFCAHWRPSRSEERAFVAVVSYFLRKHQETYRVRPK